MKIKSLLVAMMALATMASCSNEDDATSVENAGTPKSVRLSLDYASTRAIGDPATAGRPTLTNIYVLAYEDVACTKLQQTIALTTEQAAALTTTDGSVTVAIPAKAMGVKMIANNGNSTVIPDPIVSYQDKNIKTEIPYVGQSVAGVQGSELAGYTAAITVAPQVARIEVSGIIKATDADNGCTVTIDGVYMNKYISNLSSPAAQVSLVSTDGETITDATAIAGMFDLSTATDWSSAFTATTPTKCAGYQLFAGSYAVALAVTVTPDATKYPGAAVEKGFVVIKKFTGVDNLQASKIYKLNLTASGLEGEFHYPDTPVTPDPSGEQKTVNVNVTVTEWTEENVTPEL